MRSPKKNILLFSFIFLLAAPLFAEDLIEVEHLWLTQTVHISAEDLCQDGQYIYFRSFDVCVQSQDLLSCADSLKITPIYFIERVDLPGHDPITHFFNIKTTYEYLRYELLSDEPVKNYSLVESKQKELPICYGMKRLPEKKIRKVRAAREEEVPFFTGLIESGISIINSPYGKFDSNSWLHFSDQTFGYNRPKLRSPLCNSKLNYDDLVNQASGEWTGNGVVKIEALNVWHQESLDLYFRKSSDKNMKDQFQFFCVDEESNV